MIERAIFIDGPLHGKTESQVGGWPFAEELRVPVVESAGVDFALNRPDCITAAVREHTYYRSLVTADRTAIYLHDPR